MRNFKGLGDEMEGARRQARHFWVLSVLTTRRITCHRDGRWQRFGHFVARGDAENRSIGTSSSRRERSASLCAPRIHVHGPLRGLEGECDRGKVVACPTNRVFAITSPAT